MIFFLLVESTTQRLSADLSMSKPTEDTKAHPYVVIKI
jgi:hypothetical protein